MQNTFGIAGRVAPVKFIYSHLARIVLSQKICVDNCHTVQKIDIYVTSAHYIWQLFAAHKSPGTVYMCD